MKTLGKLFLTLTLWLTLHTSFVQADLVGPYSNSVASFDIDANGLVAATGTDATGSLSLSGVGTRMFWFPAQAAFRAGRVDTTQWDAANIGWASVAFGASTKASGWSSTALGYETVASGWISFASGSNTLSSNSYSTAMGSYTSALGSSSTALGWQTIASGNSSTAGGFNSQAWADYSSSFGYSLYNASYANFAVGTYNLGGSGGSSNTTWISTEPIFEVGNGTSSMRSDALIVYKNGNSTFQGPITILNPSTDIPVYTGS